MPDGAMEHRRLGGVCLLWPDCKGICWGRGIGLLTGDLGWTTRVEIRVSARPSTVIRVRMGIVPSKTSVPEESSWVRTSQRKPRCHVEGKLETCPDSCQRQTGEAQAPKPSTPPNKISPAGAWRFFPAGASHPVIF